MTKQMKTSENVDPVFTTEELAERYNCGIRTIIRWRSRGTGPKFIPTKPVIYSYQEVLDWERRASIKSTAERETNR